MLAPCLAIKTEPSIDTGNKIYVPEKLDKLKWSIYKDYILLHSIYMVYSKQSTDGESI